MGRSSGASVLREKVKRKRPAPGRALRAASATARRNSAAERARFQIPCATTRSTVASPSGRWSMGAHTSPTRPATPSDTTRLRAASSIGQDTSVPTTVPPCAAMDAALRAAPQPTSRIHRPGQRAVSVRTNSRRTLLASAVEKLPTMSAPSQRLVSVSENAPPAPRARRRRACRGGREGASAPARGRFHAPSFASRLDSRPACTLCGDRVDSVKNQPQEHVAASRRRNPRTPVSTI